LVEESDPLLCAFQLLIVMNHAGDSETTSTIPRRLRSRLICHWAMNSFTDILLMIGKNVNIIRVGLRRDIADEEL
jgi:hypothetical protein